MDSVTLLEYLWASYNMQTKGDWARRTRCVQPGMTSDIISLLCVTRVSPHQLLNQYFVVIHNFLSIIHGNVRVVYLIVLLTIKSNFLKILKDANWIRPTTGRALGSSPQSDQLILHSKVIAARGEIWESQARLLLWVTQWQLWGRGII